MIVYMGSCSPTLSEPLRGQLLHLLTVRSDWPCAIIMKSASRNAAIEDRVETSWLQQDESC